MNERLWIVKTATPKDGVQDKLFRTQSAAEEYAAGKRYYHRPAVAELDHPNYPLQHIVAYSEATKDAEYRRLRDIAREVRKASQCAADGRWADELDGRASARFSLVYRQAAAAVLEAAA